jgi:hypothetical protein
MMDDDAQGPEDDDSESFGGTLGRTVGGAAAIFLLIAVVGAVAWLIFK